MKNGYLNYILKIGFFFCLIFEVNNAYCQPPVGHWTFELGEELIDKSGNFGDLRLKNTEVEDGCLYMDSACGAYAIDYTGPNIGADKTLITWLYLEDLEALSGAPFAIESYGKGAFDAISYNGLVPYNWCAGGEMWNRTSWEDPEQPETIIGELVQIALVHESIGENRIRVSIYRNGDLYISYESPFFHKYYTGSTHAKFGFLGNSTDDFYIWIHCRIEEAQLYNRALSQAELQGLKITKISSWNWTWCVVGGIVFVLVVIGWIWFRKK